MNDPTTTTDDDRWRIEPVQDSDLAPSAFPMPDAEVGDTACDGTASDPQPDPDSYMPAVEEIAEQVDTAQAEHTDADAEPVDPVSGVPLATSTTADVDQGDGTTPAEAADQEDTPDGA